MEIIRQAEQFGTPMPEREPAPDIEKVADQLTPAPLWQGPDKADRP